jgi:hypothetical protein
MSGERLPIDPTTGHPLPPRAQPGYYPGFHTLDQQEYWDDATRAVVLERVHNIPPIRFFAGNRELAQAIFDRIMPQDDRLPETRIPILHYIDNRLSEGITDGYRFIDVPSEAECYRMGFKGIEEIAQALHGASFTALGPTEQDEILESLRDNRPGGGQDVWAHLSPKRFFQLMVQDAAGAYYCHPFAWDEVGFGGPAYPRGYMRIERGEAEPWEVEEQVYAWEPPPDSRSGRYEPEKNLYSEHATPGQPGTH